VKIGICQGNSREEYREACHWKKQTPAQTRLIVPSTENELGVSIIL